MSSVYNRLTNLVSESYDKATEKNMDVFEKRAAGDLDVFSTGLQIAGNNAGMVADVLGAPIGYALEATGLDKPLGQAMQYVAESPVGQYAKGLAEEYPTAAANLGAVGNLAGIAGAGAAAKGGVNALGQTIRTQLPDFYKSPVHALYSTAAESAKAVPAVLRDTFTPQGVSNKRNTGLSSRRRAEISGGTEGGYDNASAYAGTVINRQSQGRKAAEAGADIVEKGPLGQAIVGKGSLSANTEALKGKTFNYNIPENTQNRHWNDITTSHKTGAKGSDTEVFIKHPYVSNLGSEAAGLATTGSTVTRNLRGSFKDGYLATYNKLTKGSAKELPNRYLIEIMQMSKAIDMDRLGKRKLDSIGKKWNKLEKNSGSSSGRDVGRVVMSARLKQGLGGKLTKKEEFFLKEWDKSGLKVGTVKDDAGNVISSQSLGGLKDVDGSYHLATNYLSQDKSLGGVRNTVSVDTSSMKMYSTISDGHDLFGKNPLGGHGAITVVPTQTIKIGANVPLTKRYTVPKKTQQIKNREQAAVGNVEEMTGIPKLPTESPQQYNKRAIGEASFTPELQDYQTVARRLGTVGVAAAPVVSSGMLTGQPEPQQQ